MKLHRHAAPILAVLLLLCGSCRMREVFSPVAIPVATAVMLPQGELDRVLDAQLGLLKDKITPGERERAMEFLEKLWPLRTTRLANGGYQPSEEEERLAQRLNQIYARYTIQYLGDAGDWTYENPPTQTLAEYRIVAGELATRWVDPNHLDLWEQMTGLLPQGAFEAFHRFVVFTDGPDETLAYVNIPTRSGEYWEIAIDLADAGEDQWFWETVIHEYSHYLTLNRTQVDFSSHQTTDTYNEEGMQSFPDSYINHFYQRFWTDLLPDRLADRETFHFFLRHETEFYNAYASTDPSEDLAESFTYFITLPPPEGEEIWMEKLNFFYDYPELVEFRSEVRQRMALDSDKR